MSTVSSRPAVTLRLSGGLREKVIRSGYGTVADLLAVPFEELATELKLTQEQSNELIWQLQGSLSRTAYLTWEREATSVPITASSSALDSLFPRGKGVPPGKITEFCGRSGTGKTQLGIQLCINTQLPVAMGGSEGTSVFIDTEGSFIARRVAQIAQNSVEQMYQDMAVQGPAVDDLMRGIHYCRVHSAIELVAMVRMLRGIVQAHPKIKLVVIDTISSLFRSNFSDTQARTRLVANLGRQLVSIARDFDIAVSRN
ncbi:DNA repair protein rad51c [Lunasporangiospora selenospora]|uniref:DNA repair protein RAD51 homolog 3 n=1 Tax=Lunasporangiospora selenospora TaxID=979761 RepID=A0A9P6FW31_9FUNG|nr:DNA repair protein rad51c [Lunasporangiospora selenospora]